MEKFAAVVGASLFVVLASVRGAVPNLVQLSPTLYQTEHCLFVIDASVDWSSPTNAYNDLYNFPFAKLNNAYDALMTHFPATYFSVCYVANTGDTHVPSYIDRTAKPAGINETSAAGTPNTFATTDLCRYNLSGGVVSRSLLGVFDHELGHAWGARAFYNLPPAASLSNGHWLPNSTVDCQMSATYSADGYLSVNKLYGDPIAGFRWQKIDNLRSNDREFFSEQALYLMGLRKTWPTAYVLNNPIYNSDQSVGYSSVDTFDHAAMVADYGARNPDYTTGQKRFKLGFVYIARDLAEVNAVFQSVEESANQFCNGENIDPTLYRFQVPFLCDTKYRASVDGLLSDLDGNATPSLTVTSPYVASTDGTATIMFTSIDPDGPAPTVSLVPATAGWAVVGNTLQVAGLPDGVHFFTLKAVDAGGKKTFDHFVVEVQRPVSATVISSQPVGQTVVAGGVANFFVVASGSPGSLSYQWFRCAAGESTWNALADGAGFSGSLSDTLAVVGATTQDRDEFLCVVSSAAGTATSNAARLVVNETVPVLVTQPGDRAVGAGSAVSFSVGAAGAPATFGYSNYQWQRQTAGSGAWTDLGNGAGISGATSATLGVSGSAGSDGDRYRCLVTNTAGTTISNAATLTVGVLPSITTQPVTPVTATAGQTVSFSVVAAGTAPLAYQWSRYGVPLLGATSSTLTIASTQVSDAGAYTVDVTNVFGLARSSVASLSVTAGGAKAAQPAVSITSAATGTYGVAYTATASGGTGTGAIVWTLGTGSTASGAAINATTGVVTFASTGTVVFQASRAGDANYNASAPTADFVLSVGKATATVTFGNVSATYDGLDHPVTATTVPAGLNVSLVYSGPATVPNVAGRYSFLGTIIDPNYFGFNAGIVTISPATPVINWTAPAAVYPGAVLGAGQLNATASTPGTFTYSPAAGTVLAGGIQTLTATFVPDDTANYSNASAQQTLTVITGPVIITQPLSGAVFAGDTTTFVAAANGAPNPTYQWQHNGVDISFGTNATLTLNNVRTSDAGSYAAIATNVAGSVTSRFARLVVLLPQANATDYIATVYPTAVTAGGNVGLDYLLTNLGTRNWGANHFLSIRDSNGTFVAFASLIGVNSGESKTVHLSFPAPPTPGSYAYRVQAFEGGVEFFDGEVTFLLNVMPSQSNSITYNTTNFPVAATPGSNLIFNSNVTNTGTASWGVNHSLNLRDSSGATLATSPLNGVTAGQSKTVNLSFSAPATPGIYSYSVKAVETGGAAFNAQANLTLTVLAPQPNAIVYTPTRSTDNVTPGATVNLRYSLSNAGTGTWGAGHYASLRDGQGNFLAFVPLSGVAPLGTKTVGFSFVAPTTPGVYPYYVQALQDGVEFFDSQDLVTLTVLATPIGNAATYDATTFPITAARGASVAFSSNLTNRGTKTWGANHYLSLRDADNIFLAFQTLNGVAPGSSQNVSFTFTAPTSPGVYTYHVQGFESGIEFFAMSDNLVLIVP